MRLTLVVLYCGCEAFISNESKSVDIYEVDHEDVVLANGRTKYKCVEIFLYWHPPTLELRG